VHSLHPLDNPVWHALTGPQATVAEGGAHARRYHPAIAPFAALPDELSAAAWDELRSLVSPSDFVALPRANLAPPDGWDVFMRIPCVQMVATTTVDTTGMHGANGVAIIDLTVDDVPDMRALVDVTRPGPFLDRTIELGRYVGVRADDGQLVAMAGERMRLPGYVEMSAICTLPEHRGRGLATGLVIALLDHIRASGATPMLHAVADNTAAIKLYEQLGFATRLTMEVAGVRPLP